MIFLDNASTTKVNKEVLETYVKGIKRFDTHPDNDSNLVKIRVEIKNKILSTLRIKHKKIIFTSGGTEANNLAIIGFNKKFESKKHYITSYYEHSSVIKSFQELERLGHEVSYIKPNKNGVIESEDIMNLIKKNTVLISIMKVNNELGTINYLLEIIRKVKKANPEIVIMSDYVQGLGMVDYDELQYLDMFTISAHKINGLKSSGILVYNENIKLNNIFFGGDNEVGMRPGTQDMARELAFVKALDIYLCAKKEFNIYYLKEKLKELSFVEINCDSTTHIININIKSTLMAESIKTLLYNNGVVVSTKSACSVSSKRSKSLEGIGLSNEKIDKSIRISIEHETSKEEIDEFIKILKKNIA